MLALAHMSTDVLGHRSPARSLSIIIAEIGLQLSFADMARIVEQVARSRFQQLSLARAPFGIFLFWTISTQPTGNEPRFGIRIIRISTFQNP